MREKTGSSETSYLTRVRREYYRIVPDALKRKFDVLFTASTDKFLVYFCDKTGMFLWKELPIELHAPFISFLKSRCAEMDSEARRSLGEEVAAKVRLVWATLGCQPLIYWGKKTRAVFFVRFSAGKEGEAVELHEHTKEYMEMVKTYMASAN